MLAPVGSFEWVWLVMMIALTLPSAGWLVFRRSPDRLAAVIPALTALIMIGVYLIEKLGIIGPMVAH